MLVSLLTGKHIHFEDIQGCAEATMMSYMLCVIHCFNVLFYLVKLLMALDE